MTTLCSAMVRLSKAQSLMLRRCVCAAALLLVLAGHLTTLGCTYWREGGSDWHELLASCAVLCSVLLLLPLARLLPERAAWMCQAWLAGHVTWGDDGAGPAVGLLYDTQVRPLLDAFGLAGYAAPLETLDFWWWCLQGLLLVVLVKYLVAPGSPCEDESDDEDIEVVVVVGVGGALREEARHLASRIPNPRTLEYHGVKVPLPAPRGTCITSPALQCPGVRVATHTTSEVAAIEGEAAAAAAP